MSTTVMTEDMLDGNWSIGAPPPPVPHSTSFPFQSARQPPPPAPLNLAVSQPSNQSPIPHLSRSTDQLAQRDVTGSPALPDQVDHNRTALAGHRADPRAQPVTLQAEIHTEMGQAGEMAGPTRRAGDVVSRVTSNYTNQVLASNLPAAGVRVQVEADIQRTMKASKIQHDVVSWYIHVHAYTYIWGVIYHISSISSRTA